MVIVSVEHKPYIANIKLTDIFFIVDKQYKQLMAIL